MNIVHWIIERYLEESSRDCW